jgi:hypothetical protein
MHAYMEVVAPVPDIPFFIDLDLHWYLNSICFLNAQRSSLPALHMHMHLRASISYVRLFHRDSGGSVSRIQTRRVRVSIGIPLKLYYSDSIVSTTPKIARIPIRGTARQRLDDLDRGVHKQV